MSKIVAFKVEINGVTEVIKDAQQLKDVYERVVAAQSTLAAGSPEFIKLQKTYEFLTRRVTEYNDSLIRSSHTLEGSVKDALTLLRDKLRDELSFIKQKADAELAEAQRINKIQAANLQAIQDYSLQEVALKIEVEKRKRVATIDSLKEELAAKKANHKATLDFFIAEEKAIYERNKSQLAGSGVKANSPEYRQGLADLRAASAARIAIIKEEQRNEAQADLARIQAHQKALNQYLIDAKTAYREELAAGKDHSNKLNAINKQLLEDKKKEIAIAANAEALAAQKAAEAEKEYIIAAHASSDAVRDLADAKRLLIEREGKGVASVTELRKALKLLTDEYYSLSKAERKEEEGLALKKAIKSTTSDIDKMTKQLQVHNFTLQDSRAALNSFAQSLFSIFSGDQAAILKNATSGIFDIITAIREGDFVSVFAEVGTLVASMLGDIAQFNAQVSDAEADVAKNANLSVLQVQNLTQELTRLDTRTPLLDLLKIGDALGKLGTEVTPQVIGVIDKLNVSLADEFGNNPEKIATVVGKLKTVFHEFDAEKPDTAFLHIGNALNKLASTGASTSPVIAEFATRIAGTTGIYGLNAAAILGVSTTLEELGTTAYRGSSGFARFVQQITKDTDNFTKTLGLTPDVVERLTGSLGSFTDLVNSDVEGAFKAVLGRIKELNLSATEQAAVYKQLHINGVGEVEVVNKLSQSMDLLNTRIKTSSQSLQSASSVEAEFAKKNENLAGNIAKLGNNLQEGFIHSGFANWLSGVIGSMADWYNISKKTTEVLVDEQAKLNGLGFNILELTKGVDTLKLSTQELNTVREQQLEKIKDLQASFPEHFGNIKTETAETALLLSKILALNGNRSEQNALIKRFKTEHPEYIRQLVADKSESSKLVLQLLDVNTTSERRLEIYDQLKSQYPAFFAKLSQELDLTNQLSEALGNVNLQYDRRKEFEGTKANILGDTPQDLEAAQKRLASLRAEANALKATLISRGAFGLKFGQDASLQDRLLADNSNNKSVLIGAVELENNKLAEKYGDYVRAQNNLVEKITRLTGEFTEKNKLFTEYAKGHFASITGDVSSFTDILKNSNKEFDVLTKKFDKARKDGDFTAESEVKARLEDMQKYVKGRYESPLIADFLKTTGLPADLEVLQKTLIATIATFKGRVSELTQAGKGLNPGNPEGISLPEPKVKKEKVRPDESSFNHNVEAARKEAEDYKAAVISIEEKLQRELEEARAKQIEPTREREKLLAEKAFKDEIATLEAYGEKKAEEQYKVNLKYERAIEEGNDILKNLKANGFADTNDVAGQVAKLQKERVAQADKATVEIDAIFKRSSELVFELYAALKEKKAEIDKKYDEQLIKDIVKAADDVALELTNKANDDLNKTLDAIGKRRDKAVEDALDSNLSAKKKRAELLRLDRLADEESLNARAEALNKRIEIQQNKLNALEINNKIAENNKNFVAVPQDIINKEIADLEKLIKEKEGIEKQVAEKRITLKRAELAQLEELEKKRIKHEKEFLKAFLDALTQAVQARLQIEKNNAEAVYNHRKELLDKEYGYKERLYANDADNLARIQKNKLEEQQKLEREYAREKQKLAIKEAESNAALAIIKVFATAPDFITASIEAGLILYTVREQIAVLKSQKFAKGGYTGTGSLAPDETGEVPVGVVHAREYVIPRKVLETPEGRALANQAETLRRGQGSRKSYYASYAEGGFVGKNPFIIQQPQSLVFDEKSISLLASKVYDAVLNGSHSGVVAGTEQSNRLKDRQAAAKKNSVI